MKKFNDLFISGRGFDVRGAVGGLPRLGGAALHEELDALGVSLPDRGQEYGDAVLVHGVDVGAATHEEAEDVELAVVGGEVTRPSTAVQLLINIRCLKYL